MAGACHCSRIIDALPPDSAVYDQRHGAADRSSQLLPHRRQNMPHTFDELCATIGKAHSVFDLSHVPLDLMQGGLADAAARIKALEAKVAALQPPKP